MWTLVSRPAEATAVDCRKRLREELTELVARKRDEPNRTNAAESSTASGGNYVYCTEIALWPRRSTYFWIFPVAVLGNADTNSILLGTLKWAMCSRAYTIIF